MKELNTVQVVQASTPILFPSRTCSLKSFLRLDFHVHFTIVVELFSTFLAEVTKMHPTTTRHTVLINEVNGGSSRISGVDRNT